MAPKLVKGIDLNEHQRLEVLEAFGYRWTVENKDRATKWSRGKAPTSEPETDEAWIAAHAFYIRRDGTLALVPAKCEPCYLVNDQHNQPGPEKTLDEMFQEAYHSNQPGINILGLLDHYMDGNPSRHLPELRRMASMLNDPDNASGMLYGMVWECWKQLMKDQ